MRYFILFLISVLFFQCERKTYSEIGDDYFSRGKYYKAIDLYNKYLKLHPKDVKTIYNKARAYEELKKYNDAFILFKQALELDSDDVHILLSIAKQFYRMDNFDKSAFYAKRAVDNNTEYALSYYWLGRALHQQGKIKLAIRSYSSSIRLDAKHYEVYLYRGAAYKYLREDNSACKDFRVAAKFKIHGATGAFKKYCQ